MSILGRVCIGIRTHRFGQAEQDLYASLNQYFAPKDIFVVVDETRGAVEVPSSFNKIGFNRDTLNDLGLFSKFNKIGWLCGDYFYYVMHRVVGADAYWLVEPDVRFTFRTMDEFFGLFADDNSDLLLTKFGKREPRWGWYRTAQQISSEVYGCAFPLSRSSRQAVERLLAERQQLTLKLQEDHGTWKDYPNDEAFVATAGVKLGLTCSDFRKRCAKGFSHFSVQYPYLWPAAKADISSGKVVHPALLEKDFWVGIDRKIQAVLSRSELGGLIRAACTGGDAGHSRQVRAAVLSGFEGWLNKQDQAFVRQLTEESRSEASADEHVDQDSRPAA